MKTLKQLLIIIILLLSIFAFTGCKSSKYKADQEFCNKIKDSITEGNPLAYSAIVNYIGTPTKKVYTDEENRLYYCVWIEGYKSVEEAEKAVKNGETVYSLIVSFDKSKSTAAVYSLFTIYDE